MKYIIIIFFTAILKVNAQTHSTLEYLLEEGVYQTTIGKKAILEYSNAVLAYENYRKSFLPSISMSINPLNFSNSMKLLQSYNNGDYWNVTENANTMNMGVIVSQKIGVTGGTFSASSSISFLREFSNNNNSFSTVPFRFSYSQQLIGGYNTHRMESEIQRLKRELAEKQFISTIVSEQKKILSLYLSAYSYLLEKELLEWTDKLNDTLLIQAKAKLHYGKITEDEYEEITLQQISNRLSLQDAVFSYERALRKLCNEVNDSNIIFVSPKYDHLPMLIDEQKVSLLVNRNNPEVLGNLLQRKNAEYTFYKHKLDTHFNANISLSYGTNQYANNFSAAYAHPASQQMISMSFLIPVFQWGMNHNKRTIATNDYKETILSLDEAQKELRETIRNSVFNYNQSIRTMQLAEQRYKLSRNVYTNNVRKYCMGKISTFELSSAYKECQGAEKSMFNTLQNLLENYANLRSLTLYDFVKERDINVH